MNLELLAASVEHMAEVLLRLDIGGTFSGMTCDEAASIAEVLAVAGRLDAAAHVLMMHGDGDMDDEDHHQDVYLALQEPGAGYGRTEANEPFRLAMRHARELLA